MAGSRTMLALGSLLAALPLTPTAAVTASGDPLPRIEDKLCPATVGMPLDPALTVLDRVRANALRVGIGVDDPDKCNPNLVVGFVDNPGKTLNRLMDDAPRLFSELSAPEKRRLRAESGQVIAWNVVRTKTRDGMPVTRREGLVDVPEARMWSAHSKIYSATREDIVWTIVLFDRNELGGTNLKQLADYVSMRAFSSDYSGFREAERNSILTLFADGDERPAGLTEADLAYLDTLYEGIANLPGTAKVSQIENEAGG